jgi:hydrogenase maturation protease
MTAEIKKILLIGFGNPARADDGLGPAVAENIEMKNLSDVTVDADYQLTVEDSAAVAENDVVIFADSSVNCTEPFTFEPIMAAKTGGSFSSHSVEPAEVMGLAQSLFKSKAKGYTLAVRGYKFDEFDAPMTKKAKENLAEAIIFLENLLKTKNFEQVSLKGGCKCRTENM